MEKLSPANELTFQLLSELKTVINDVRPRPAIITQLIEITFFTGTHAGSHEKRLLHHLLDNYNVLERPVANESDPLQLSFGLTLMQIIDVVSVYYHFYLFRFLSLLIPRETSTSLGATHVYMVGL